MRAAATNGLNYRFHCDGVVIHESAISGRPEILAASIAGPAQAIKALRGSVGSGIRSIWPSFDWLPAGSSGGKSYCMIPESGLRFSQTHRLGFGLVHMCFVAKMPTLLPSRLPETLWQYLDKTTTTPLKREWMDFIVSMLKESGKIITPKWQHNLNMAICHADDATLDAIVRSGIKHGKISI